MAKRKKNKERVQMFWGFNVINMITTGGILAYLFIYFCEPFPVEAYHVGLFAIIQSVMSFVLNYIVYKHIK